jgi:hypothetical protein
LPEKVTASLRALAVALRPRALMRPPYTRDSSPASRICEKPSLTSAITGSKDDVALPRW